MHVFCDPTQWGAVLWQSMHWIAAGCPDQPNLYEQQGYKQYFESVALVIPCAECRNHFQHILEQLPLSPPILSQGAFLRQWVFEIHNAVNTRLGKPVLPWTLVDIDQRYPRYLSQEEPQEPMESLPPEPPEPERYQKLQRLLKQREQRIMENNHRSMGKSQRNAGQGHILAGPLMNTLNSPLPQARTQARLRQVLFPQTQAQLTKRPKKACNCKKKP